MKPVLILSSGAALFALLDAAHRKGMSASGIEKEPS
jgi:hypothetical protein